VAAEAGVGEEWVSRFAAPVIGERLQVIGRARRFVYSKPRRGASVETLDLSVRWNLADRGVRLTNDEYNSSWSAYQVADHTWMLTFTFISRQRVQQAEWEVELDDGGVFARNRLASDLGYVEPGTRRRSAASLQPTRVAAKAKRALESPEDRPALPIVSTRAPRAPRRSGAKKAAVKKAVAKKAAAKKAVGKKAAAKKAVAKKAVAKKAVAKKAATKRTTTRPAATRKAAAKKKSTSKRATATRKAKRRGPPAPLEVREAVGSAPSSKPPVNELGQRKLQLVAGNTPSRPYRRSAPPQPRSAQPSARPPGRVSERFAARATAARTRPAPPPEPDRGLDVVAADEVAGPAVAEARRAERRRARAAARRAAETATPAGRSSPAMSRAQREELANGDGRVVTIRANRATPPRGDGDEGEVVLPPNSRPLRPAQAAAQPRRRRFSRTTR
jgi:hypothetical protein